MGNFACKILSELGNPDVGECMFTWFQQARDKTFLLWPSCTLTSMLQLAGWGTNENNTSSDVLMWANQTYIPYSEYLPLLVELDKRLITHDKFCVNHVDGVGIADQGDSGGGLTMLRDGAHYVYGVVSTRPSSNSTNVRLFTNVLNDGHIAWLRRQWQRLLLTKQIVEVLY